MEPWGRCVLPSMAMSVLERMPSIHALLGLFKSKQDRLHPLSGKPSERTIWLEAGAAWHDL